ncbi:MAG: hypothetical protein V7K42_20890 [Nostoc sp.]
MSKGRLASSGRISAGSCPRPNGNVVSRSTRQSLAIHPRQLKMRSQFINSMYPM